MAAEMTWGGLLGQTRFLLQDEDSSRYRYPDDKLLAGCHMACLTMKQVRPDIFYGQYLFSGTEGPCFPAPPYTDEEMTEIKATSAPFPSIYYQPAILFITGWAEIINEEFTGGDRAAALISSFKNQLMRAA